MYIQTNEPISRERLAQKFKADVKGYLQTCEARRINLGQLFQEEAPEKDSSRSPEEALFEVCAHLDLYPSGSKKDPSSTVEQFLATPAGTQLFWAVLHNDYETALGLNDMTEETFAGAASETDLTPGGSFSPYAQLPLENKLRFSPRFPISALTPRVQTIPGLSYEQPEFQGPTATDEHVMKPIAPNAKIPTTTTVVGERQGKLKKIGEGLKIDDNIIGNNMFMEAYRMQVQQIALRTEQAIVNNGVEIMFKSLQPGNTNFDSLGSNPDLKDVIEVNLEQGVGNVYQYNLLIMRKSDAREWIYANINSGTDNTFAGQISPGRFDSVFPNIRLINNISGPTSLAFVGDSEIDTWTDSRFIATDPRFSLIYVRRGQAMRDDSDTDIETQTRRRFLSQMFDWWLVNPNGVKGWRLS